MVTIVGDQRFERGLKALLDAAERGMRGSATKVSRSSKHSKRTRKRP
jgi:hypothetical protein